MVYKCTCTFIDRLCITDALSNRVSSCPECGLPGWLNDLKGNKQLGNIVHLLTCMEEQISPFSVSMSNTVSAIDTEKQQDIPGTTCCNPYSAVISAAVRSKSEKCVFVKPQMETKLIKRLKSSLSPRASTCSASNVVNDRCSSPITEISTELKKRRRDLHTPTLSAHSVKSRGDLRKPMSIKQSSFDIQEFVSCASNTRRDDTVVHIEFEDVQFSLVMKTRTLDTNDKILGLQESGSHSLPFQKYLIKAPPTLNKTNIQQISVSSLTNGGMYNFAYIEL